MFFRFFFLIVYIKVFIIPSEQTLQSFNVCRESCSTLQYELFQKSMLLEAQLLACVILPFTCCFEFFSDFRMKKQRKRCLLADVLELQLVFFLCCILISDKQCFPLSACWDLTCFEREREGKSLQDFPKDVQAEDRKDQLIM